MASPRNSTRDRRACVERWKRPHPFIKGRMVMYCAACDLQIDIGLSDWQADHCNARELGGPDDADNIQPLCIPCHKAKTRTDVAAIAKVKRVGDRHYGIRRSVRPMPCGRHSKWKKKMSGEVVER